MKRKLIFIAFFTLCEVKKKRLHLCSDMVYNTDIMKYEVEDKLNDSREKKTLVSILIGFAIILVIAVTVAAKTGSKQTGTGTTALAVVEVNKDTNNNSFAVVIDRYGKDIMMDEMQVGEMVLASYVESSSSLKKIIATTKAWESTKITKFSIDSQNNIITIANKSYKLDDKVFISSNGQPINLMDLNAKDQLTIKGIDKTVYSIIVTKGHGYIRLKNYDAFVGGNIEVGYDVLMPISKDMLVVAREGEYKVLLEKDGMQAIKHVNIIRDQETIIDMSDYKIEEKEKGKVTFKISPDGADLVIDGKEVDYSDPVELLYGEHTVEVTLTGYLPYSGKLTVSESKQSIKIKLEEDTQSDADATATPEASTSAENDSTNSSTSTNTSTTTDATATPTATATVSKTDYSHKITVTTPEGAEVYLNGTYKGVAPVSMVKEIGNHTVSLRKSGYTTKSYMVQVSDDNKDVSFTFPDLETSTN